MSVTKETIVAARDAAMRRKIAATEEERPAADKQLSLMRQLLGAIGEAETAGKTRKELSAAEVLALLKKEHSKRMASAEIYEKAGAKDRSNEEAFEAHIIAGFLPVQAPEEALRTFLTTFISENDLPAGRAALGPGMKALNGAFVDFDRALASKLITELSEAKSAAATKTFTCVGAWVDDELEIEYTLEGSHTDHRPANIGDRQSFCASAEAANAEEAERLVLEEYANAE